MKTPSFFATTLILLFPGLVFACQDSANSGETAFSDYFRTLAFRESPYAPHKGIHRISQAQSTTANHYRFDFDAQGRVQCITFALGEDPRPRNHTANYFWHTTSESHRIEGQSEQVRYFDEWGDSATVQGDVAMSEYTLDNQGRRVALHYFDNAGQPVESAWGIHRYVWQHLDDGSVIESRFSLANEPVHLRPGFEFGDIRLAYDAAGFTRLMQHVNSDGSLAGAVDGFVQDRFSYSPQGELVRYDVLDAEGEPASNHQGISSGLVSFTPFGYEHVANYQDAKGHPARNEYGWWRAVRAYDDFGNLTTNAFQNLEGQPTENPLTGYATAVIEWHEDGLRRRSMRYFDANHQPTVHASRGYHAVLYGYDPNGFPTYTRLVDVNGNPVEHATQGWTETRFTPNTQGGKPLETRYSLDELKRASLEQAMQLLHETSHVPGLAAAIAIDGEVTWHGEAGLADIENEMPIDADTVFRLASVSKAVTSVLVARELERGTISLESPANQLLPIESDASLEQLLAHTGGVEHYTATVTVDLDRDYVSSIEALPTVIPHIRSEPPGSRYLYSTFGYTLAGAMLESAANSTLPQMLATLAEQYGLGSLAAPTGGAPVDSQTDFYALSGTIPELAERRNFSYSFAGAGMVSNASDLARLMSLFAAGRIVGAEQLDRMFQPARLDDGGVVRERNYEVALGWRRQTGPTGQTWYHHAGVTDGARTIVAIDPARSVAVVILGNASWTSDMFGTAMALERLYFADTPSRVSERPASIEFEGASHELAFDACNEVSCSWYGPGSGPLVDWLSRSGRGAVIRLQTSGNNAWLATPYGLSWFNDGVAHIGARQLVLEPTPKSWSSP